MAVIKSQRAKKLLLELHHIKDERQEGMRKFPGLQKNIWMKVDFEGHVVKNLSLWGELLDYEKVLLESMARLMVNRLISHLDVLTPRECEAYLRDRNSEVSIESLSEEEESELKSVFRWARTFTPTKDSHEYHFSSENGRFDQLKLSDKIKEIKAYLASSEVSELYQNLSSPELIDVDGLTIFIHVSYETEKEKKLFETLHQKAIEVFGEEELNFIPES